MEISNKNRPVKIGVISLWALSLFLILFIFYIIGSNQKLFTTKYSLYMFLPNVQGLNSGAFVTLSGLKVGVVGDLEFTEKDGQPGIRIELKISKNHARLITTSSKATVSTMGVLGDKYVDISLGDLNDAVLKEGMYIQSNPMFNTSELISNTSAAIQEFQVALKNINKITEATLAGSGVLGTLFMDKTAQHNISQLIKNLTDVSDLMAQGRGTAGKLVQDTVLYSSLARTAENLNKITTKVNRGEGGLGKLVADTTLYTSLRSISIQADSLLRKIHRGEGTAGKLIENEQLYDELLKLTRSLTTLTNDINQNPKKYVTFKVF